MIASDRKEESKRIHSSENNIKSTAVLVDVDKTLLLGAEGSYNTDLINALINTGHDEIYLFTSMTLREIVAEIADPDYSSRPKLVKHLEESGIKVLKILTPADVVYNKGIGAAYNDLFLKHHQRIGGELTDSNYFTDIEFNLDRNIYSDCHKKTADQKTSATEKSELYQYFLTSKAGEIHSCIIIDDIQEHLTGIAEMKVPEVQSPTCILVDKDSNQLYFEKMLYSHYTKYISDFLWNAKANKNILNGYVNQLNINAKIALEEKNYDKACRYFEIVYLLGDLAKLAPERIASLLKDIKNTRINTKSINLFDNIDVDTLYKNVVNSNVILMQLRKIQLNTDLFKFQYEGFAESERLLFSTSHEVNRDQDFEISILNPCATLVCINPETLENCIALLRQVQSLIPVTQYINSIEKLRSYSIEQNLTKFPSKLKTSR